MDRSGSSAEGRRKRRSLHWHVMFTHFPVSTAAGALLFMGLHVLTGSACYVLASYVTVVSAAIVIPGTTATGWWTWRLRYRGTRRGLFLVKVWTSAAMVPVGIALALYQTLHPFARLDVSHDVGHALYFAGLVVLLAGSVIEGYWGGKIHHP